MDTWTVMFYMNADHSDMENNNVSGPVLDDLVKVGSGENLHIIVLLDRFKKTIRDKKTLFYPAVYQVKKGEPITNDKESLLIIENENMGSPKVLSQFVEFCKTKYTATKYVLVIWDHGGGYFFEGSSDQENVLFKFNQRLNINHLLQGSNLPQRVFVPFISPVIRNFFDFVKINGDSDNRTDPPEDKFLYPFEISKVIKKEIGKTELLVFDACWMATLETAFTVKDCTSYVVASENTLDFAGIDYYSFLTEIKKSAAAKTEALCAVITKNTFVEKLESAEDATICAYRTDKIDELVDKLDQLCELIIKQSELMMPILFSARLSCMNFYLAGEPGFGIDVIDLGYIIENISRRVKQLKNKELSDLINSILLILKNEVIISHYEGKMIKAKDELLRAWGASGLSIFFPENPLNFYYFKNIKEWYFDQFPQRSPFSEKKWKTLVIQYFNFLQKENGTFVKESD